MGQVRDQGRDPRYAAALFPTAAALGALGRKSGVELKLAAEIMRISPKFSASAYATAYPYRDKRTATNAGTAFARRRIATLIGSAFDRVTPRPFWLANTFGGDKAAPSCVPACAVPRSPVRSRRPCDGRWAAQSVLIWKTNHPANSCWAAGAGWMSVYSRFPAENGRSAPGAGSSRSLCVPQAAAVSLLYTPVRRWNEMDKSRLVRVGIFLLRRRGRGI